MCLFVSLPETAAQVNDYTATGLPKAAARAAASEKGTVPKAAATGRPGASPEEKKKVEVAKFKAAVTAVAARRACEEEPYLARLKADSEAAVAAVAKFQAITAADSESAESEAVTVAKAAAAKAASNGPHEDSLAREAPKLPAPLDGTLDQAEDHSFRSLPDAPCGTEWRSSKLSQ